MVQSVQSDTTLSLPFIEPSDMKSRCVRLGIPFSESESMSDLKAMLWNHSAESSKAPPDRNKVPNEDANKPPPEPEPDPEPEPEPDIEVEVEVEAEVTVDPPPPDDPPEDPPVDPNLL